MNVRSVLLAAVVAGVVGVSPAAADVIDVQVIADVSVANEIAETNPERFGMLQIAVFSYLHKLSGSYRVDAASSTLTVIHSAYPRTVWSGSLQQLGSGEVGQTILNAIRFQDGYCNNMAAAFEVALGNAALSGADRKYIIALTSGIDTGNPCYDGIDPFAPVPDSISPKTIFKQDNGVEGLFVIGVLDRQKKNWEKVFGPEMRKGEKQIMIIGEVGAENQIARWTWE